MGVPGDWLGGGCRTESSSELPGILQIPMCSRRRRVSSPCWPTSPTTNLRPQPKRPLESQITQKTAQSALKKFREGQTESEKKEKPMTSLFGTVVITVSTDHLHLIFALSPLTKTHKNLNLNSSRLPIYW